MTGVYQRYGQYRQHFIDYNSDQDADLGDEDGSAGAIHAIVGDDDDLDLGNGPELFASNTSFPELYLVRRTATNTLERLLFRWHVEQDAHLSTLPCDIATASGSGCHGRLQILRLDGTDIGLDHDASSGHITVRDGVIDTWVCHEDFDCPAIQFGGNTINIPTDIDDGWVDVFPDFINVKDLHFYVWPNKNPNYAWADQSETTQVNPYLRIDMTLGLSGKRRNQVRGVQPEYVFSTTINLTD